MTVCLCMCVGTSKSSACRCQKRALDSLVLELYRHLVLRKQYGYWDPNLGSQTFPLEKQPVFLAGFAFQHPDDTHNNL